MRRILAGEREAFEELVTRHGPGLRRTIERMLGRPDVADEAVQEVFLRAWNALGSYRGDATVRGWLYRIATNHCRDLRKRPGWKERTASDPAEVISGQATPEDRSPEQRAAHRRALGAVQAALTARLRQDPALRKRLARLEQVDELVRGLGEPPADPDPELTRRVMERIAAEPAPRPAAQLDAHRPRRTFSWPTALAACLLLLIGFLAGRFAHRPAPREGQGSDAATLARVDAPEPGGVVVHFVLEAGEARTVSVVGTFNGWAPEAHPMHRSQGRWIARLRLPPGRHEYQFLIDGERWIVDPSAPSTAQDGFGGVNGVLEI
ncbi:MAG: sigma-70 family RNA polymerase sigma factor [Deltaproteobacteria bacterium]|nr:sigma-70 family RNA polymerase sigma factor [Deltaproteobacteria bacterium]